MPVKKGKESPYFIDRTGEIHINNSGEDFEIIDSLSWENNTIKFKDGTLLYKVDYGNICRGSVKNPNFPIVYGVGYLGVGEYTSRVNGIKTEAYKTWTSILRRCYNEKERLKSPTYQDVTVCKEWKCFQNFAKWHEANYKSHMKGWHLDKDILQKGNKIYSPQTCDFVPRKINNIFTKRQNCRGDLPIGVTRDGKAFAANITKNGKKTFIKNFNSPEKAFNSYKLVKEEYIKEVAEEFIGLVSDRMYLALLKYTIEITD